MKFVKRESMYFIDRILSFEYVIIQTYSPFLIQVNYVLLLHIFNEIFWVMRKILRTLLPVIDLVSYWIIFKSYFGTLFSDFFTWLRNDTSEPSLHLDFLILTQLDNDKFRRIDQTSDGNIPCSFKFLRFHAK